MRSQTLHFSVQSAATPTQQTGSRRFLTMLIIWLGEAIQYGLHNIDSFKLILPNDRVVPTQLIYNPGEDYEVDPQAGNENDSSSSGSGGGSNHTSPNLGGSLPEGNFGFGFGFDSLPSHSTVTWTITTSFYRVENG